MRKYEALWTKLKVEKILEIELQSPEIYTPAQINRQLKTIRKAVSKEKYIDFAYKFREPHAEVTSVINEEAGTITFNLIDDLTDVTNLF